MMYRNSLWGNYKIRDNIYDLDLHRIEETLDNLTIPIGKDSYQWLKKDTLWTWKLGGF